jgi:hypothetical protein
MRLKNYKLHFVATILIIIIILLVLKVNSLTFENFQKSKEIESLDKKNKSLIIEISSLEKEIRLKDKNLSILEEKFQEKIQENKILNESIISLENKNLTLLEEYTYIKNDLLNFKESINESMDWFKENSTIDVLNEKEKIEKELLKCIECTSKNCYIKTACIDVFVNRRAFDIEYIFDTETSSLDDRLQPLQSFLDNKGGDCEDFSLFFTAQLRYLIQYSLDKGKAPIIESFIDLKNNNYFIYQNWYYENSIEYRLNKEFIYPYIACGNLYDIQKDEYGGHCVVLISKNKINNFEEINLLKDSYLIEPQTGRFIDFVEYNGFLEEKNNFGYIYYIITDNDFYIHKDVLKLNNSFENEWYSYNYYLEKINFLEKEYN